MDDLLLFLLLALRRYLSRNSVTIFSQSPLSPKFHSNRWNFRPERFICVVGRYFPTYCWDKFIYCLLSYQSSFYSFKLSFYWKFFILAKFICKIADRYYKYWKQIFKESLFSWFETLLNFDVACRHFIGILLFVS